MVEEFILMIQNKSGVVAQKLTRVMRAQCKEPRRKVRDGTSSGLLVKRCDYSPRPWAAQEWKAVKRRTMADHKARSKNSFDEQQAETGVGTDAFFHPRVLLDLQRNMSNRLQNSYMIEVTAASCVTFFLLPKTLDSDKSIAFLAREQVWCSLSAAGDARRHE